VHTVLIPPLTKTDAYSNVLGAKRGTSDPRSASVSQGPARQAVHPQQTSRQSPEGDTPSSTVSYIPILTVSGIVDTSAKPCSVGLGCGIRSTLPEGLRRPADKLDTDQVTATSGPDAAPLLLSSAEIARDRSRSRSMPTLTSLWRSPHCTLPRRFAHVGRPRQPRRIGF
jgi:hypothetical protein